MLNKIKLLVLLMLGSFVLTIQAQVPNYISGAWSTDNRVIWFGQNTTSWQAYDGGYNRKVYSYLTTSTVPNHFDEWGNPVSHSLSGNYSVYTTWSADAVLQFACSGISAINLNPNNTSFSSVVPPQYGNNVSMGWFVQGTYFHLTAGLPSWTPSYVPANMIIVRSGPVIYSVLWNPVYYAGKVLYSANFVTGPWTKVTNTVYQYENGYKFIRILTSQPQQYFECFAP